MTTADLKAYLENYIRDSFQAGGFFEATEYFDYYKEAIGKIINLLPNHNFSELSKNVKFTNGQVIGSIFYIYFKKDDTTTLNNIPDLFKLHNIYLFNNPRDIKIKEVSSDDYSEIDKNIFLQPSYDNPIYVIIYDPEAHGLAIKIDIGKDKFGYYEFFTVEYIPVPSNTTLIGERYIPAVLNYMLFKALAKEKRSEAKDFYENFLLDIKALGGKQ